MGLVIAAFVLLGHGWGLNTGLFLDDHSHFAKLRAYDWSYQSAVDAARLGIVGEVLDVWNRHETGLRFFRPIAFWTMKIEYTLAGWNPAVMHAFSLLWHWTASMLVAAIAFRCFGRADWAGLAGAAFAVHPGQVACTYWVASQTELQVTVWMLLATLCYVRYSAWPDRLFAPRREWYPDSKLPASRRFWLLPSILFISLALGCRENAVMYLPLIFVGDFLFRAMGPSRFTDGLRRMRWGAYVLFTLLLVAYMGLRWTALGGFPLPGKPYLITLEEPGFLGFIFDKFVLNMLALFAYIPVIPLGGLTFFQARPAEFYLPFLGIVVGWVLLLWSLRRRPGILFPFAWMFLVMLPLLPVFSSPHHLYMPTVGFTLILASALGIAGGLFLPRGEPVNPKRGMVTLVVVMLHGVGLTFGCWAMGWVYRSSTGIEDLVLKDIRDTSPKPIADGDHLFFINIPMMAYYVVPALEMETGMHNLNGHALTFSPTPLLMDQPCRVEQLDEYTLRVEVQGEPYFSGISGRVLLDGMKIEGMPATGDKFDAGLYVVTIEDADETGIRAMHFAFTEPLSSPEYHFFLSSRERLAYALYFPTDPSVLSGIAREDLFLLGRISSPGDASPIPGGSGEPVPSITLTAGQSGL